MKVAITASVTFVVQDRTDPDDENRHRRNPSMPFELMDPDNYRQDFVNTLEEAELAVQQEVENSLGLSGGVVLGSVHIETKEIGEGS